MTTPPTTRSAHHGVRPTTGDRLRGLAATTGLLLLIVGIPIVLELARHRLLPEGLGWDDLELILTSPSSGTLALIVVGSVTWVAWAYLTLTVALELVVLGGRMRTPSLFGLPRGLARRLVATASLLFVVSVPPAQADVRATDDEASHTGTPAAHTTNQDAQADHTQPRTPPHTTPEPRRDASVAGPGPGQARTTPYTVTEDDSLWSIAQDQLGDPLRFTEIKDLNRDALAGKPDFLIPGMVLRLPTHTPNVSEPETDAEPAAYQEPSRDNPDAATYLVLDGDTLTQIALDELGDTDRYPDIARASADTIQPGGDRLTDPNHILPGWRLTIPAIKPIPTQAVNSSSPAVPDRTGDRSQATPGSKTASATATAGKPDTSTSSPANEAGADGDNPPARLAPDERTPDPHTTSIADTDRQDTTGHQTGDVDRPAWMLPALGGAGAMLAAGLLAAVRRRRATQWRYRRPGHTIAPVPRSVVPLERTIHVTGPSRVGDIDALDRLLRALAGPRLDDPTSARPRLVAIELTDTDAIAHLARPADLPLPWVGSGIRWSAPLSAAPVETDDLLAPYPLLVSVGMDAEGHTWLLDLEQARAATVTGDPQAVESFGRYITAELLLHPWAENTTVHSLANAWHAGGLSGTDTGHHHDRGSDVDTLACVAETHDAVRATRDATTHELDWSHAVIAATGLGPSTKAALGDLVTDLLASDAPAGTAVVILESATVPETTMQAAPQGLVLELRDGRLLVPELGWDLAAVGLTEGELAASIAILEVTRATTTPPTPAVAVEPASPETPQSLPVGAGPSSESGSEQSPPQEPTVTAPTTEPRPADPQAPAGPWSLLPAPATDYVRAAATTVDDVAAVAPVVPPPAEGGHDADPDLDQDVAAWFDPDQHHRARLMLLGPVTATAYGDFFAVARLKALHVEALAYLVLHPNGTTGAQLAEEFAIKPGRARSLVAGVRAWLGVSPLTGKPYVPDAKQTAAFTATGKPAYQVDGLLVDIGLFQRLHTRARTRGADGIDDLVTALKLVRGRPFDKTRARGWTWLFEGERIDHTMAALIGDVAHLVCTRAMTEENFDQARWAAQLGRQANPDDETSRLDDITIQYVTGHAELARKRLAEEIYDRSDDEWPPPDPPERTHEISTRHRMTPRPPARLRPRPRT